MPPTGFYVHVPFCDGKCPYCAFYSVLHDPTLAEHYVFAVAREMELRSDLLDKPALQTAYIGGGTPSVLSTDHLRRLLALIPGGCLSEFTVETNPADATPEKLAVLAEKGVNRLSIGAQSFDDATLSALGRRHNSADIHAAIRNANSSGFTNLGLDLIACTPGAGHAAWQTCLDKTIDAAPQHISVYALTIEEGTRLAKENFAPLSDEQQLEILHTAEDTLTGAGYRRYEISNYALPGFECEHNRSCWRGGEYLGLGPSASSHEGNRRWTNSPDIRSYISALEDNRLPPRTEEVLSPEQLADELLMLGLRTDEGVDLEAIRNATGVSESIAKKWFAVLSGLAESTLVVCRNEKWKLTSRGRDLADRVAVELLA